MLLLLNGKKNNSPDSFSLVEVAISLGIVSFACLTVLGLIPTGLISFQQAMNNTVESEIVQSMANDISLTTFDNLAKMAAPITNYYDSDGIKTNSNNATYAASVTFADLNRANTSSPLYGIANYTGTTANIQIIKQKQHYTNFYSVIVGNNQAATNSAPAATW